MVCYLHGGHGIYYYLKPQATSYTAGKDLGVLCVQRSRGAAARGKTGTGIEPDATVPRTTPTSAAFLAGPPRGMGLNHIPTSKGPTTTIYPLRGRGEGWLCGPARRPSFAFCHPFGGRSSNVLAGLFLQVRDLVDLARRSAFERGPRSVRERRRSSPPRRSICVATLWDTITWMEPRVVCHGVGGLCGRDIAKRVALWPSPEAFFCLLLRPWVEGSAGVGERKSAGNAVS